MLSSLERSGCLKVTIRGSHMRSIIPNGFAQIEFETDGLIVTIPSFWRLCFVESWDDHEHTTLSIENGQGIGKKNVNSMILNQIHFSRFFAKLVVV